MPGNTASLTFKLFGIDINASRTISGVGVAAAGTAKDLEMLSVGTLKFVGVAGAAGVASVGLAGTLGVGLGAAFAGVGVAAALMNKNVKKEFKDLGQGIKNQISAAAKPVQDSMLQLFKYISSSIKTMAPLFHSFFAAVAPLVTIIGQGLVQAVVNLVGEFTPLVRVVTPIVNELFAQLPDLIGNIAFALNEILSPLSGNTKAFGTLLQTIGSLLPIVGSIIGSLVRLGQQIMPAFQQAILGVGTALDSGLAKVLPIVGRAINQMLPAIGRLAGALFPALAAILRALLPVLSGVVAALAGALAKVLPQLVPAFVGLIQVVGQLLKGIQPLLPSLIYLAVWIGKVANNLLSAILPVVTALLGGLMPALKVILPVIIQVANQVGVALAAAFKQAQPALVQIAKAAGQVLIALTPLIPVVVTAALSFLPIIPAAAKIASVLAQGLVPIVLALTPLLVMLAPTLVKIAIAAKLWTVAQGILNVVLAANPLGLVIVAVAALAAGLVYAWKHSETFRDVVKGAFNAIKIAIGAVITFIIGNFRFWFDVASTVVLGILRMFGKLPGPLGAPFRAAEDAVRKAKTTVDTQLDKIQRRVNQLTGKDIPVSASLKLNFSPSFTQKDWAQVKVLTRGATGGLVIGPGGPTSDQVPALLSAGEFVMNAAAVRQIGVDNLKRLNALRFALGGPVGTIDAEARGINRVQARGTGILMDRGMTAMLRNFGGALGGSADVRAVAMRTLALLGRPLAELGAWIRRIMFESGGNASAVNRSDSNWFAGHPSVGLAQVIRGTFAAWAGPFAGVGPFLYGVSINPLANSFAGANYAIHRYGSLFAVDPLVRHAGYDRGGWLQPGLTLAYNGTGRPERVGGGGITFIFNGPVYGDKAAFVRDVTPALRQAFRQARRAEGRDAGTV